MSRVIGANNRLILSAIADRLIYGDPATFSPEDASELARLLPAPLAPGLLDRLTPSVAFKGNPPGTSRAGIAAGVGQVSLKEPGMSFDLDSRGRRVIRAGQWKFFRTRRAIEIEHIMADDHDEARTARLEFRLGQPVKMSLLVKVGFVLGPLALSWGRFTPWKMPG